jgi:hypothetical protein
MLSLLERLPRFARLKSQISDLKSIAESCSRQLRAWAASLQESPIEGQRRLTQSVRNRAEQQKRAEEFTKMLKTKYKPVPVPNPPKTQSQAEPESQI